MDQLITSIHHVTVLSGNAQKKIEFYSGIPGLKLAKKTVSQKLEPEPEPLSIDFKPYL